LPYDDSNCVAVRLEGPLQHIALESLIMFAFEGSIGLEETTLATKNLRGLQ
jgi:hypothetical protein